MGRWLSNPKDFEPLFDRLANAKHLQYYEHINFMGYASFEKQSPAQLAKHIRTLAKNSRNVVLTDHLKQRMAERNVSNIEVLECLKLGSIRRAPEINHDKQSLECRMERQVLKRELACIVALCDENPNLIIVTVFATNN